MRKSDIDSIKRHLERIADERNDLALYKVVHNPKKAFEMCEGLIEDKAGCLPPEDYKTLTSRVEQNKARYERLCSWILKEKTGKTPANGPIYSAIYRAEQEDILYYCYVTILLLLQERDILNEIELSITNSEGSEHGDVSVITPESLLRSHRTAGTKAAKSVVDRNIRKDILTDEEIESYDTAYNEAYVNDGGSSDSDDLNPARKAREKREELARKAAERALEKAKKAQELADKARREAGITVE